MPRHHRSAGVGFDLDTMGPGMDNDARRGSEAPLKQRHKAHRQREARSSRHEAPHPVDKSYGMSARTSDRHQGPQATSIPGRMGIITDVMKPGKGAVGVPGIISSTTLGPEVRHRLVAGIIESVGEFKARGEGPVHRVAGVDSTAYNEGMVHIAGSRFK